MRTIGNDAKRAMATDEEVGSLISSRNQSFSNTSQDRSNGGFWKAMTICLFGTLMLFLTDTVELKKLAPSDSDGPLIVKEKYEDILSAGHVETKPPHHAPTLPPTGQPTADPTAKPIADPAAKPKVKATADPIATPTAKAADPTATPTVKATADPTAEEADPTAKPTAKPVIKGEARGPAPRHTYKRRGQPMSEKDRKTMEKKWGTWTLVDNKNRPTDDFYKAYPNRDIPRKEFPRTAWQIDKDYLAKFLPEAIKLVERSQEAILAEYGWTDGSWENRTESFSLEMFESLESSSRFIITKPEWKKDGEGDHGGYSTYESMKGLKQRLLHAVMTEDTFIVAMGGHSAAAGHGNHFVQSYTVQVQWILEAVFARLGVKHTARNLANGGLGTIQHGLAASSVYGPSIDMLVWDSSMTEKDRPSVSVFARQGLLGGNKVPVLWHMLNDLSKELSVKVGVDVGSMGRGTFGFTQAQTWEQVEEMPWATRCVKYDNELKTVCADINYRGHCWDENRTDFVPETKQDPYPGGRAKWHPGFRRHQVTGRVLAFTILSALKEGLAEWNEADGYNIPDESWHLTERYEAVRNKYAELDIEFDQCNEQENNELEWVCKYPTKGRTEFTPRAYPALSNIRSLMHPDMAALVPTPDQPVYEPPELFLPDLHPPEGAIDVLNIVEAGVEFKSTLNPDYASEYYKAPTFAKASKLPFGKGVGFDSMAGDEYCDGSADSFCGKGPTDKCLLAGTNDRRNGLIMDSYSGWTVLNIPDVKYGYIALKLHKISANGNPVTEGWTSENGGRQLGEETIALCNGFKFEYAIDGVITSLNHEQFRKRLHDVQRVVQTITILKDEAYTGGVEKEIEIGLRFLGCGREDTFQLSHVYWA